MFLLADETMTALQIALFVTARSRTNRSLDQEQYAEKYKIIYFFFSIITILLLRKNKTIISWTLSPWHGASSGCGWKNGVPRYEGYLRIYLISSRGQPTIGGPPAWWLGELLTTHRKQKCHVTKHSQLPRAWTDPLVQRKRDVRFGMWTQSQMVG